MQIARNWRSTTNLEEGDTRYQCTVHHSHQQEQEEDTVPWFWQMEELSVLT